jgi:hypothetical protein
MNVTYYINQDCRIISKHTILHSIARLPVGAGYF